MKFCEQLNIWLDQLNCSGKDLAQTADISETTMSRYRQGDRVPKSNSGDIKKLAKAISYLANKQNILLSVDEITASFFECSDIKSEDNSSLTTNFNLLVSTLNISTQELSKYLHFDASYISRIRSGQRTPANPQKFANDTAELILQKYNTAAHRKKLSEFLKSSEENLKDPDLLKSLLLSFLLDKNESGDKAVPSGKEITHLLSSIDDFDLNKYIHAIHFDELKVPTLPFQLPTSRFYTGVEEMKQGELDFLKSAAVSSSKKPVLLYSDMPMEDMAKDADFAKKYMFGLACLLKKGLHLNMIHNIDRPIPEMMLGLEAHIPLYMTGQISPYYIPELDNSVFMHFLKVAGNVALSGECINGNHNHGRYYLSKTKEDLKYYQARANDLLTKAKPLMDIYNIDNKRGYNSFYSSFAAATLPRKNILSTLPIYTLSEELLEKILEKNNIPKEMSHAISVYRQEQKKIFESTIANSVHTDKISVFTKEAFDAFPVSLTLSDLFLEKDIVYDYDDYLSHLEMTKKYAASNPNYILEISEEKAFRNIQIRTLNNECVIISKSKAPVIHFVIHHPKLVDAICSLVMPVTE